MRKVRWSIIGFILVLTLNSLTFAQTQSNKIAVVDTEAFDNEQTGIKEIVDAYDKLEAELKPKAEELNMIADHIQKLAIEIREIQSQIKNPKVGCYVSLEEKIDEYDKLTKEYKQKEEMLKKQYEKRKPEICAAVFKKVGDAIQQFAKEKGYAVVIDTSKLNGSAIIENPEEIDITNDFIKYYNEKFAINKTQ